MKNIEQLLKNLSDQNEKDIRYQRKKLKLFFVLNSIVIVVFSIGFIQQYGFNIPTTCLFCTSFANAMYGFILEVKHK